MGAVNKNGVWIYSPEDTVSTWEGLLNLGMNSVSNAIGELRQNSLYKAANEAGANAIRDRVVASGITPTPANPIIVYITNTGAFYAWDGANWRKDGLDPSAWMSAGSTALIETDPKIQNNVLLWGTRGLSSKYVIENGVSIVGVDTVQGSRTWARLRLQNSYQGIATVLVNNSDLYSHGYQVCASSVENKNTIWLQTPSARVGTLIRVSYSVHGWKE